MDQPVEIGVAERLPGGLDDVLSDADRCPGIEPVCGLDQHAYGRIGAVTLIENSYLVVDQLEFLYAGIGGKQRVAEGLGKRVHATVRPPGKPAAFSLCL